MLISGIQTCASLQSQNTVSNYLLSQQIPYLGFARRCDGNARRFLKKLDSILLWHQCKLLLECVYVEMLTALMLIKQNNCE